MAWRYVLPGAVKGAKVVKMKWVDRVATRKASKGPIPVKSRLCAQEFAWDLRGDTFAGTPPLGCVKLVLSNAATGVRHAVMVTDITCAFLHATMSGEPPIVVVVPVGLGPPGMQGLLLVAVYGTRRASFL